MRHYGIDGNDTIQIKYIRDIGLNSHRLRDHQHKATVDRIIDNTSNNHDGTTIGATTNGHGYTIAIDDTTTGTDRIIDSIDMDLGMSIESTMTTSYTSHLLSLEPHKLAIDSLIELLNNPHETKARPTTSRSTTIWPTIKLERSLSSLNLH